MNTRAAEGVGPATRLELAQPANDARHRAQPGLEIASGHRNAVDHERSVRDLDRGNAVDVRARLEQDTVTQPQDPEEPVHLRSQRLFGRVRDRIGLSKGRRRDGQWGRYQRQ